MHLRKLKTGSDFLKVLVHGENGGKMGTGKMGTDTIFEKLKMESVPLFPF
jgi:hypothetical protein